MVSPFSMLWCREDSGLFAFDDPIFISINGSGRIDRVSSPRDALHYLFSNVWPNKSGTAFEHAAQACIKAMSGDLPCANARSAFLVAARLAHVLTDETDTST
jgi:hypothetical protein